MPGYQTTAQRYNQQNQTESLKTGNAVSSPKIESKDGRGIYRSRDTLTIDKPISIIIMMMKYLEKCGPWIIKSYYPTGITIWGKKK